MSQVAEQAYGAGGYGGGAYLDPLAQSRETTAVDRALIPLPPPIFSGMKLKGDVLLGDLRLNTIDENNVVWVCTDIEGWWGHPDPEIPDVTRGWRDGSYDARGRWQARQITLTGSFFPPDSDYVSAARDRLIESTALVYSGAWLKTIENPTKAAYVRLSGRPEIAIINARGRTDFSIGLRAADPIRYSWNDNDEEGYNTATVACKNVSTSATGETTITNEGNTDVAMFIEVTGPIVGDATIYNQTTDETITITGVLRDSSSSTITNKALTSDVATLTTSGAHSIVVDDVVSVTGVDATFDGTYSVTAKTANTFSYDRVATNVSATGATGTVVRPADVLEIDTYERAVSINGLTSGARATLATLVDWMSLVPGENNLLFADSGALSSTASMVVYYRSGWIG